MNETRTVAGAYAKIEAHEEKCDLRHQTIQQALSRLEEAVNWILRGTVAVLLALVGWLAVQVYNGVRPSAEAAERLPVHAPAHVRAGD